MNRRTFYRKLRQVANQFNKRREVKKYVRLYKNEKSYCPITAVCLAMGKGDYSEYDFIRASKSIGLSYDDTLAIVAVADSEEKELSGGEIQTRRALNSAVSA